MNLKGESQSLDQSLQPAPRAETSSIGTAAPSDFALPSTTARSVDLQIDELVLDGFSSADRHTIGEAVERELARLLSEGESRAIARRFERDHIDAGSFETRANSSAAETGKRIAKAIYGGLKQ